LDLELKVKEAEVLIVIENRFVVPLVTFFVGAYEMAAFVRGEEERLIESKT
jgi:hypothetical protein